MTWHLLDLNPEPWRIGPVTAGRRNGGTFATVGQDKQLAAYKNAITQELGEQVKLTGKVQVKFYFWREQITYESLTSGRKIQKHVVDATNMQKATEDALQGIFFDNDNMVARITSEVVAQGPDVSPKIVINIEPYSGFDPNDIPVDIWAQVDAQPTLDDNVWSGPGA